MYQDHNLHIGGKWRAASDGATRGVTDPATEAEIGKIAVATDADIDAALDAAAAGFATWRHWGTWDRAAKLRNRAQEITRRDGCSFTVAFRAAEQELGQ